MLNEPKDDEVRGVRLTPQIVLNISKVLRKHKFSEKHFVHLSDSDWQEVHSLLDDPVELKAKIRALRATYDQNRVGISQWWRALTSKRSGAPRENTDEIERKCAGSSTGELPIVLVLGTMFAGKSTLFRYLEDTFGERNPFITSSYKQTIVSSLVHFTKNLIEAKHKGKHSRELSSWEVEPCCCDAVRYFATIDEDSTKFTKDTVDALKTLFVRDEIQKLLDDPNSLFEGQQLENTSCQFFIDKIDELAKPNYDLTTEDAMRLRVRTTGFVDLSASFEARPVRVIDAGGAISERKKWSSVLVLDGTKAVVFAASLSAYNETMYEDSERNQMVDSINLLHDLMDTPVPQLQVENTIWILLLTKAQIFKAKLRKVPLATCFPEYTGPNTYSSALSYIQNQYVRNAPKGANVRIFVIDFFASLDRETPAVVRDIFQHISLSGQTPTSVH